MEEQTEHFVELRPGFVSLVETLIWGHKAQSSAPIEAPYVTQMVYYLCGALSKQAMMDVDEALVAHPASCGLLEDILTCLEELQKLPWAEVAERGNENDLTAQVARTWLGLVSHRVQAATHAREHWLGQGWSAVRRQVAEGRTEAQVAWAAFISFGQQLTAELLRPRVALARNSDKSAPTIVGTLPPGVMLVVTLAEIMPDGALRVAVSVRDAAGKPSQALAGNVLSVSLASEDEDAAWPIASGSVEEDHIEWNIASLGAALGLPKGQVPASYLRLALEQAEMPLTDRSQMLAEVLHTTGAPRARIEWHGEPRWQDGQFSAWIAIPPATRAAYPSHRLQLDVLVSTGYWQRLGEWPVSDWDDAPRLLTASCPGSADSSAFSLSFLRARMQTGAEERQ